MYNIHIEGGDELTKIEKAEKILEFLDNGSMNINWNFKDMYVKDIVKALNEIENIERGDVND